MQPLGIICGVFSVWCYICAFNSLRPIRAAEAILESPSDASKILSSAHTAVALTASTNAGTGGVETSSDITSSSSGSVADLPTVQGSSNSDLDTVAKRQAYANELGQEIFGSSWTPTQMNDLILIWNKESGWNPNAYNASSGAHGIPQALATTRAGSPAVTLPVGASTATQIAWGLEYIKGRYGTPSAAWQHEITDNWY